MRFWIETMEALSQEGLSQRKHNVGDGDINSKSHIANADFQNFRYKYRSHIERISAELYIQFHIRIGIRTKFEEHFVNFGVSNLGFEFVTQNKFL